MIWLRILGLHFLALFRKGEFEQQLSQELQAHLEMLTEENLRHGMSPEEARYVALRSFGGVDRVKEEYRDQRGLPIIETLAQDIRSGLSQLRRNPAFAAVAILTLALGVGANTAIFSAVYAVLLKRCPFEAPANWSECSRPTIGRASLRVAAPTLSSRNGGGRIASSVAWPRFRHTNSR